MRTLLRFRPPAWLFPLVLLALAIPRPASGQPVGSALPELAPEVRGRLSQAAGDTLLPPWQRDLMKRLAGGATAAGIGPAGPGARAQRLERAAEAADGSWSDLIVEARCAHSAIYDPVRDRMVVFAGAGGSPPLNDVWALSLAGAPAWTRLTPSGTPPGARYLHSAIYDPVRDRMVVFGGEGETSAYNDVWELSLAGSPAWTLLAPSGTPPGARLGHSAIYDPVRDRMVVFGGEGESSAYNDVWELSLAGSPAWTLLTPGGTPPGARYLHSAIYDPVRNRMVVFGGAEGSVVYDNVWELWLTGAPEWAELTNAGTPPSARGGHSAIYDPVRDRMVVFGGIGNDVWTLSLAGTPAWTTLTPTGTPPSARYLHGAIYDPLRGRMLVFGGADVSPRNDVWALSLAALPAWTELTPAGTTPPSGRYCHSAVYDPMRDRMVVFGGYEPGGSHYCNDLWSLSLAGAPAWTKLTPSGTPPAARDGHSAIYDPVRDRMLVFGGFDGGYYNDVWSLVLSGTPAWTRLTPAGAAPGARYLHSAIYDPVRDRMVVYAGFPYRNDVWTLSLTGTPAWTQLWPGGAPFLEGRCQHSAVYDPVLDRMVVFGGHDCPNDVRVLTLGGTTNWELMTPGGTPPSARYGHSATYDPVRQRMTVFGGWDGTGYPDDAWALEMAGMPTWRELAPGGDPPGGRDAHGAVYDPVRDRLLVFGGDYSETGCNDLWALAWGAPANAAVACPGAIAWTPGTSNPLMYGVTNPYGFAQVADYTLTSGRAWPGFPISGSVAVGAASTLSFPIQVPVPDTVSSGVNPLTLHVTLRSALHAASCSHDLYDATTPALLSLVDAVAEPTLVRLTWYAAHAGGAAMVYRRTSSEAWSARDQVPPDGAGLIVYEDREVAPGARYGYRLGLMDQGREVFAGETWVDVPLRPAFALAGVRPNPAGGDLTVSLSLPDASPARLEAFDLAGRRIVARDVGSLGGGSHVVRLAEARALAPGFYLLRLTRGDRALTTRVAIVR